MNEKALCIHKEFMDVYMKFKLHFYQEVFERSQQKTDRDDLTTLEMFCVEAIQALGRPTVNEFSSFMRISSPNAAYKINRLMRKGYVEKVQSEDDRREFYLSVTPKYAEMYNIGMGYAGRVIDRIDERFTPEECGKLEALMTIISEELMPEIRLPEKCGAAALESTQLAKA